MQEKTKNRIHLIYRILLSVMLIVTGTLLMIACVGIYNSGTKPFTPEAVAAAFRGIAVPVYLCLVLVAGSFLLEWFLPLGAKKTAPEKQYGAILRRLHEKLDLPGCEETVRKSILAEQKKRRNNRIITLALLALGSIVFLCYGMNPANFHQSEITDSMKKAMYVLLPCMAVPFGYAIFAAYWETRSLKREIALVRQALTATSQAPSQQAAPKKAQLPWLSYAVLTLALVFLLYGFFAGGTKDVLTKAVNICTECVGLG